MTKLKVPYINFLWAFLVTFILMLIDAIWCIMKLTSSDLYIICLICVVFFNQLNIMNSIKNV